MTATGAWRRRGERAVDADRPSRFQYSTARMRFRSAGADCVGTLYRPDRPVEPPVVLMGGGLAAERRFGLPRYAERFAERGYAALTFDYRHFGDSEGDPRQLLDPTRQIDDWAAALGSLRRTDGVDADRIALWGFSLGGGHALRTAAGDSRVAAVVALMPIVDGSAVLGGRSIGERLRGTGAGLRDRLSSLVGRGPHTVPVVGDADELALLNGPGIGSAYLNLVPADAAWENAVPARAVRALSGYRALDDAAAVRAPTLLVAGDRDDVAPAESIRAAADDLSNATYLRAPASHFDGFEGRTFERLLGHQLSFLDAELGR